LHCTLTDSEEATGQEGKTMATDREAPDPLLTPAEVAVLFRVNPKTVSRWARSGKLTSIRTLGGHRRFRASEVRSLVEQSEEVVETF
jgi:excisionase family DNA binding protein